MLRNEFSFCFSIKRPIRHVTNDFRRLRELLREGLVDAFSKNVGNVNGLSRSAAAWIYVSAFAVARVEHHVSDAFHLYKDTVTADEISGAVGRVAVQAVGVAGSLRRYR